MDQGHRTQGYLTDIPYPDRFFRELSPAWLNYVAALHGARVCDLAVPFDYLELGCGHGRTALINAAAFPQARFHACDLNAEHIANARQSAATYRVANVQFHEASFADLLGRGLPRCDFIVLHGVYSWVDARARQDIRAVLAALLKDDGLVYVSYNCMPAWASELPLRKLLVELAASVEGDSAQRTEAALQGLLQLNTGKLQYLAAHPAAAAALAAYQRADRNYLVHELMNPSWEPFYSIDVADELAQVGLAYVGSATLPDNHSMLLMDEHTAGSVAALSNERQRRLAEDCATNRRFRRDVFVRGTAPRAAATPQLGATPVGALRPSHLARHTIRVPRGELTLQTEFMHELQPLLSRGPRPMQQLVGALLRPDRDAAGVVRNLLFLVAGHTLLPCARSAPARVAGPTRYANETVRLLIANMLERGVAGVIPSPVLGNGVPLDALEALAIEGMVQGATDASGLGDWLLQQRARPRFTSLDEMTNEQVRELARRTTDDLLPALLSLSVLL